MRRATATTLLYMHFNSIQQQRLLRSHQAKKDEILPKVLLHSGTRLQVVTKQSNKEIIGQRIAARQTCCSNMFETNFSGHNKILGGTKKI